MRGGQENDDKFWMKEIFGMERDGNRGDKYEKKDKKILGRKEISEVERKTK